MLVNNARKTQGNIVYTFTHSEQLTTRIYYTLIEAHVFLQRDFSICFGTINHSNYRYLINTLMIVIYTERKNARARKLFAKKGNNRN